MKKIGISLGVVFSLILLMSSVCAFDLTLSKTKYYPGETLQLQLPDIFTANLVKTDIKIYEGTSVHETPVDSGIIKYNSKYYYYAVLPVELGNYSLRIENMAYRDLGKVKTGTLEKNFTIVSTNSSYLSFNPGAIYALRDFSVKIKGYNVEQDIDVSFDAGDFEKTINLGYEQEETVLISIAKIKELSFSNLKINSYEIPIVVSPPSDREPLEPDYSNLTLKEIISVNPSELNVTILPNFDYSYTIKLVNKLGSTINLKLSSSDKEINVTPNVINNFKTSQEILVRVSSKDDISGSITITSNFSSIKIPVEILVTEDKAKVESSIPEIHEGETCENLKGRPCNIQAGESCSGTNVYLSETPTGCCIGECVIKSSGNGWIWGIAIIIILAGVGAFFYFKAKKEGKIDSFKDVFGKKTNEFEKRMNPKPVTSIEVRKSLGNI